MMKHFKKKVIADYVFRFANLAINLRYFELLVQRKQGKEGKNEQDVADAAGEHFERMSLKIENLFKMQSQQATVTN